MGWGREQQAEDHRGNVGPNPPPISAKHTSAPVPRGWALGRGGAEWGASPPAARGRSSTCLSPGSSQRGWPTASAVVGAPVAYPKQRLSAPRGWLPCARSRGSSETCSGSGASRVLAGTEITMQRAEAARRSRRRPRGRPHRQAAVATTRH